MTQQPAPAGLDVEEAVRLLQHSSGVLQERIANLERSNAALRRDSSLHALIEGGKLSLKFPMTIVGPLGARYTIVRQTGGHFVAIAAPAADTEWSNSDAAPDETFDNVQIEGDLIFAQSQIETYISSPAATSIANTSDFFQVAGTFTNSVVGEGFTVTSAGQITYTASRTRMLHTYASWGVAAAANNQIIEMGMRKNGTIITASILRRKIAVAGDVGSSALHSMFTVATGDTFDVAVRNTSGTADITLDNLNIGVLALPNDMTGVTVP